MFLFSKKKIAGAVVLACAVSSITLAEDDSKAAGNSDEKVTVYGKTYRSTGTKSSLTPMESPLSFEVYDLELLEQRQVDSVNEALRYVPGITPENRPTVTIFDQYTIRGFETYRNYYDGLPLQYNGLWNLSPQVDVFATYSVEILKGPASVLYGSAPPGGMVNQVAKHPTGVESSLLRLRAGSHNLRELALDHQGVVSSDIAFRVIVLGRQKEGQQVTTEEERQTLAPSITWQLSPNTELNINLYYQNDPKMIPSTPLPALGTLYPADYGLLGSGAYAGDKNWGGFEREVSMLSFKLNHQLSQDVQLFQNFRFTDGNATQRNSYNYGLMPDGRNLIRSAYFTDEQVAGYVLDNQLQWALHSGVSTHNLLIGAEYYTLDSKAHYGDTLANATPMLDLAAPDYNLFDPSNMPFDFYQERHDISQIQTGIYLQDEYRSGALTMLAGLRWDTYDSKDTASNLYAGTPFGGETEIDQDELTTRLAAIYTFDSGLAPYISYSESFEPESGVDSNTGKPFKPTLADQIELGAKYQNSDQTTQLTLAYFDISKKNVVVNTPDFLQKTQTGEVVSQGVEFWFKHSLTDNFNAELNLTKMDVKVTKNPLNPTLVGKTPIWVAEELASLWMNFYPTDNWAISGGARYVGESQLDAENSDRVPAYTLLDLALRYYFDIDTSLALTASNLTDKRYVGACYNANNCWMGAERSVELILSTQF
jgi:iron complex outermembrane receptor protein